MDALTDAILKQMSIEEKAGLVCGKSFCTIAGVESQKLAGLQLLDGGTGMNYEQLIGDIFSGYRDSGLSAEEKEFVSGHTPTELRHVIRYYFAPDQLNEKERKLRKIVHDELDRRFRRNTKNGKISFVYQSMDETDEASLMSPACFPAGMLLGATWNPEVVYMVGQALGREARAHGVHMLLGTPNINIHRDPRNGRLFEGYSEDPYLVSVLAPELVKGVQAEGVAANIKHFAANNQETNRKGIDETISERALHEIYFPGFRACVEKAQAATVMAAYNKINGTACTENAWLLSDILRKAWGFQGMVVSDWGAVDHPVQALKAGTDVNMPGPADPEPVLDAIRTGKLTEEELDINVRRILSILLTYGHPDVYDASCQYIMDRSEQAAYRAACEGIVLLKNENGIFPIMQNSAGGGSDSAFSALTDTGSQMMRVILCGSGALRLYDCGTGSAGITTDKTSTIYEGLAENRVPVEVGIPHDWQSVPSATYLCVARVGGMEGRDRKDLKLSEDDRRILDKLVQMKKQRPDIRMGLILNVCGPVELCDWEPYLDGIFCMFLPGMEGGHAMADILCGRVNPSGKLPITFPKTYKETPTYLNFPGDGYHVCYGEGIYVGYRYYDKCLVEPLYPFGHGLSYCNFQISDERVSAEEQAVDLVTRDGEIQSARLPVFTDKLKVSVDVENLGPEVYGEAAEVVQLYIRDEASALSKPMKECRAFQKIKLAYREKTTVTFALTARDFASYDEDLHAWVAEEGAYHILIGSSSRRIMCSKRVYLKTKSPYSYSIRSTVGALYENKITRRHMLDLWEKLQLDPAYIYDKYEYQPGTRLCELMHSALNGRSPDQTAVDEFNSRTGAICRL